MSLAHTYTPTHTHTRRSVEREREREREKKLKKENKKRHGRSPEAELVEFTGAMAGHHTLKMNK